MSLQSTPRLALPYLVAGQAQKEVTHNEALVLVDAMLAAAAESAFVNAPPASPAAGQCWIVGATPTGAWSGQANALAVWTHGGWRFLPAVEGMRAWIKDRQLWARRGASAWLIGDEVAERLLVGGEQVVGPREDGVTRPTGGAIIDAEARAAIETLIARLAAHGLIEP